MTEPLQLLSPYGVWAVEHIARRPGGDTDVVVSWRAHIQTAGQRRFTAYRHGDDGWRRVNGGWTDLAKAITDAEHTLGYGLLPPDLLDSAIAADTPSELATSRGDVLAENGVASEQAHYPDPDAAYKADLEDDDAEDL
jgi:hypothetical protein